MVGDCTSGRDDNDDNNNIVVVVVASARTFPLPSMGNDIDGV